MNRDQFLRATKLRINSLVDRALIKGSLLAISLLLAAALLVVFIGAVVVAIWGVNLETERDGVFDVIWEVMLRAMSPDQLAMNQNWGARFVLLVVTIFGLLLISTLISILNSVIERRMEFIHLGRGEVSLAGHFVVLNWNQFGLQIVQELVGAAETGISPHKIAILCDEDPLDLLQEIRSSLTQLITPQTPRPTAHYLRHPEKWVVVRRGQPTNTSDLRRLTSVARARGVIVLHAESEESLQILRIVLAVDSVLATDSNDLRDLSALPVVTFTTKHPLAHDLDQRLSRIADTDKSDRCHVNYIPINADEVPHGVETQVSRHRGLSAVYHDLLDFGGQELYVVEGARFGGTFGELLMNSKTATPLGTVINGKIDLWPDWSTSLKNCSVVVLAENSSAATQFHPGSQNMKLSSSRLVPENIIPKSEQFLFIGWNEDALRLASSLSQIVAPQSRLTVLPRPNDSMTYPPSFSGQSINVLPPTISNPLNSSKFLDGFEHVVVFTDQNVDVGASDTSVLIDLLACRHHADQSMDSRKRFTIVAELQKRSSQFIAGDRLADDLLINDTLLASAAVQLAFDPQLEPILHALLSINDPVELVTRHISQVGLNSTQGTWKDLVIDVAEANGEIAIGYRRVEKGVPTVVLNPARTSLCAADDEIVLFSRRFDFLNSSMN